MRVYRKAKREQIAEYARAYRERNATLLAERKAEYNRANAERIAEYNRANAERIAKRNRSYRLRHYFGLTVDAYNALLAAQGGACGICGTRPPSGVHLDCDHDWSHCPLCDGRAACGLEAVRGLLCGARSGRACNLALGLYEETGKGFPPDLVPAAEAYLAAYASRTEQGV